MRFINNSIYGTDNFFTSNNWFYHIKIGDYQLVSVLFNLFLIVVPLVLYLWLARYWRATRFDKPTQKILAGSIFFLWLIFVPNSVYVISEVRHLMNYCPPTSAFKVCEQNAWVVFFFFSYALAGLISYYYLLSGMGRLVGNMFGSAAGRLFVIAVIPVIALGMLLGLINRWNTWEVFIYPKDLLATLISYVSYSQNMFNWVVFSFFNYIFYFGGKLLFKDYPDKF